AADHLAQVIGMDVHLDGAPAAAGDQLDAHVIGVGDDAANEVFDGIGDDCTHYSAASADSAPSAASSFLAAFFLGVTASATGSLSAAASAALNRSSLDGLASLTFRV